MTPIIEIIDNKIYYSIPELEIEIELQIAKSFDLCSVKSMCRIFMVFRFIPLKLMRGFG